MAIGGRRRRRRLAAFKGGRINLRRLTPLRKARLERRRRKFFQEDLEFDKKRRSNRKRALFSVTRRKGYGYESKILERYPKDKTIIDVMKIIKQNTND